MKSQLEKFVNRCKTWSEEAWEHTFIKIGFGNMVSAGRVMAVVNPFVTYSTTDSGSSRPWQPD